MDIAICDSLLRVGGELARGIASSLDFRNDRLTLVSELPSVKDLTIGGRGFAVKSIGEIDFVDIFIVTHDNDLSEKIDIFKRKSTYIIEVLSPEVGKELFIFGIKNMKNILDKKHFWIPNSFTIAISNICKELNKISPIKSIFASGYNSASNEKGSDINNLYNETKGFFEASILQQKKEINEKERLAFNCVPKLGDFIDNDSTTVEDKIEKECKFFFQENNIQINADFDITVNLNKVPVFRGDSYFVKIELDKQATEEDLEDLFDNSDNIIFSKNTFVTQVEVIQNKNIFISRLKCRRNYISFYLTIDNIKICSDNAIDLLKTITISK